MKEEVRQQHERQSCYIKGCAGIWVIKAFLSATPHTSGRHLLLVQPNHFSGWTMANVLSYQFTDVFGKLYVYFYINEFIYELLYINITISPPLWREQSIEWVIGLILARVVVEVWIEKEIWLFKWQRKNDIFGGEGERKRERQKKNSKRLKSLILPDTRISYKTKFISFKPTHLSIPLIFKLLYII